MPSTSKKQHKFMTAIAHSPSFAKKAGVPQSVGKEFTKADKGRTFKKGGEAMKTKKQFRGTETYKEELGEAKAVASKKITPKQFAKFEKAEGHKGEEKGALATGKKIASGKMSPSKYAEMEMKEPKEKFSRGGGIESKGKTQGKNIKMAKGSRKYAEGGSIEEQEAMDKAAGLEESNKEAPVGFLERLRAGNIDDPSSEAYKRFGAGRGAASRAARVPVEDAVPVKVDRTPERAMGEDERPAPTGMGAATKMAPKPMPAPVARPAPAARPAPVARTAPAVRPAAVARPAPVAPPVDELEQYAASKRKPVSVVGTGSGRGGAGGASAEELKAYQQAKDEKEMFTPPSEADIKKGMEAAASMLGGGASLRAIRALAKKLASRGKSTGLMKTGRSSTGVREFGGARSEAPYLKELGNEPRKIGSEALKLGMKKGGNVKKMANGGSVKSSTPASKRGDGIATKGKTRGKMV